MPSTRVRASYDVRTDDARPNTNFAEERFLAVRNAVVSEQWSYIAFPTLPELGSVISSATLRVWLKGANWSGTHNLQTRRVTQAWKESQAIYSSNPSTSGTVYGAMSVVDGVDGQSVDIDVTTLVADALAGQPFFGVRLETNSIDTPEMRLYSSEATDPMRRPLLIVEWSTRPQAPTDLSPSGGKRVSLQKPVLGWHFRDPDGDEQAAFQVQIEDNGTVQGDGSFASPEYDSGWITINAEELDLNLAGAGSSLPTYVGSGTAASGTGDIIPGLPTGWTLNDILLIAVESRGADPVPATPGGYAHVTGSSIPVGGTRLTVFWKRATAAETAPTIGDTGNHQNARMIAIRGCPTVGTPWEITQVSSEVVQDTSGSATGLTTSSANCLLVVVATSDFDVAVDDTAGYSGWTNASLTNLTERTDNRFSAGVGGTIGIATGEKATAGAVSATTYTLANAAWKAHLVIAFPPSGAYGGSYAGISADATRWWVVRAKDEQGNISPWADVQSFTRTTKGTLAINSPTNGGTVEETTPPIITTLTGRNQEAISYLLEKYVTTDDEWVEVWSQDRRAAPANSGAAYNFGVPAGKITAAATNYRLTVRSWDTFDRDATPGDPTYVQAQSTFTFVRSATPSPVTVLTATQEANSGPGVVLTFNRAVGQASPDYFALVVNGVRVLDRIDPADILVGGSPIVYSLVWYGAEPYGQSTYEVEAVTVVSGVLKHSQSNDTENFTSVPTGIWLVDDNDAPYAPADPPRRVRLITTASPALGIAQSGATYKPVGRRDPVTIVDAIGGYEGTVTGRIRSDDAAEPASIANFRWMKRERNVGRRFRLVAGGLSIPVELGVVDSFTPVGDIGQVRGYDVSFEVSQVGDFRESE